MIPTLKVLRRTLVRVAAASLLAVATLAASFPRAEITWAVDPKWAMLLEGNPGVHRVVP